MDRANGIFIIVIVGLLIFHLTGFTTTNNYNINSGNTIVLPDPVVIIHSREVRDSNNPYKKK
jgi:hypothetical protein